MLLFIDQQEKGSSGQSSGWWCADFIHQMQSTSEWTDGRVGRSGGGSGGGGGGGGMKFKQHTSQIRCMSEYKQNSQNRCWDVAG